MIVPVSLIMVICLITFVLTYYQYYRINARIRVKNLRFLIMAGATGCALSYPVIFALHHGDTTFPRTSLGYFAAVVLLLAASVILLRRMPKPKSEQKKP